MHSDLKTTAPDVHEERRGDVAAPTVVHAREYLLIGLLLIGCLCLFFSKALFTGQVLSPADMMFSSPAFTGQAPPWYQHPSNGLLFDQVYQFTPWRYFAATVFRHGHLPLWNPDSLSGTPLAATLQSALFYPITWLSVVLPFSQTLLWSALLRLWIAGFSTYLLARRYSLGRAAALVSAISFMLCGFLIVWLGHPHTNVVIWLPALILMAERLVQPESRRRRLQSLALLALIVGIQFTGGHIESSVDILVTFGLYFALRWIQAAWPQRSSVLAFLRRPGLVMLALVLGVGLAAIQIAPFLEWMPLSSVFHRRQSAGFRLSDLDFGKQFLTLPVLLFPNLYNNPTWASQHTPLLRHIIKDANPNYGNYNETILYAGVFSLLLAPIGLIFRRKDQPWIPVWTVIGLLSLGRALHMPVLDWLNQLPGLSLENAGRLRLVFSFSLCLLAGFGAQALWERRSSASLGAEQVWSRGCLVVTLLGVLFLVFDRAILPAIHISPSHQRAAQLLNELAGTLSWRNFAFYAPAILTLAALILTALTRRLPHPSRLASQAILLSLIVADLFLFGKNYNPTVPVRDFYPTPAVVAEITADHSLYRTTALDRTLLPDAHMMFGLSDVRGMDFSTEWYSEYFDLLPGHLHINSYSELLSSAASPLLAVLNVKYVIAARAADLTASKTLSAVRPAGGVFLGQFPNVQPRSFMVYQATVSPSDAATQQMLAQAPEQVYSRVILSQPPPSAPPTPSVSGTGQPRNSVVLLDYKPSQASWRVNTTQAGYLFTSDAYYPGWNAYRDGQRTELYRADLAFRAVYLPPGQHTVSYRYEPRSVAWGALVSVVSLSLIIVLLLWACREDRQSPGNRRVPQLVLPYKD